MITSITLTVGLIEGLRHQGLLQALELSVYDRFMQYRPARDHYEPPFLLVGINEADIARFGHPLSDTQLAHLLNVLLSQGPSVIGIDIFRDKPLQRRQQLISVIKNNPRVVMIDKVLGTPVSAPDFFQDRSQIGFADLKQDIGGPIRRGLLILWDDQDQHYLSFSLQLALKYLESYGITLTPDPENSEFIRLGKSSLPRFQSDNGGYRLADDGGYQFMMDYGAGPEPFPLLSLSRLISGEFDPKDIQGKIVIVGATAASVQDQHESPFSSGGRKPMYGIEIHAHAVDQLIRSGLNGETPISTIDSFWETIYILFASFIGGALGTLGLSPALFLLAALASILLPSFMGYTLFVQGLWVPVVAIAMAWIGSFATVVAWGSMLEHKERKLIMQLFGKFVSRKVAKELWNQRNEFMDQGRPRPQTVCATVLMTDLNSYTTASEAISPTDLMDWINSYMHVMTEIVEEHHGIVEDYAGDGLKANFGVPIPKDSVSEIDEDAKNAVDCALKMGEAFATMHTPRYQHKMPSQHLRIGICSGSVTAGSIGSKQRMAYTTVGDTVNTAARLESFDKAGNKKNLDGFFRILVCDSTWRRIENWGYQAKCLGKQQLVGKHRSVTVYWVYGRNAVENT